MTAPAVTPARRSRRQRMVPPVATASALAVATLALRVRDPHERGSWGLCPSAAMGIWCPGCGGLRAVNDLTHGDVLAAASSNLLLVASLPLVAVLFAWWLRRQWRGDGGPLDARAITIGTVAFCAVGVVFGVLRNLPAGAWLAP